MPEGLRVEDLVQDSLAAVWRAVDERRLVDPAEALPYALGVAHHRWVDAMRKAGRRPGVKEWTDDGDLRESEEWDPGLAREELAASLQGLLRKSDIQLFLALRWDGLKLAEAAAGLGWSAGQAEAGRRRIQRFLSDPVLVGPQAPSPKPPMPPDPSASVP